MGTGNRERVMSPLQQFAQASGEKQRELCAVHRGLHAARGRQDSKYKQHWRACVAPEQNRLMPIPALHKGARLSRTIKASVNFPLILGAMYKILFHRSLWTPVTETQRVKERVGGVAARGFSIFSLLLTQSVNTLSVMYHANQAPRVCVVSPPRAHTDKGQTQPRTVCSQKVLLQLNLNFCFATREVCDSVLVLAICNAQTHRVCQWRSSFSQTNANRVQGCKSLQLPWVGLTQLSGFIAKET